MDLELKLSNTSHLPLSWYREGLFAQKKSGCRGLGSLNPRGRALELALLWLHAQKKD